MNLIVFLLLTLLIIVIFVWMGWNSLWCIAAALGLAFLIFIFYGILSEERPEEKGKQAENPEKKKRKEKNGSRKRDWETDFIDYYIWSRFRNGNKK